MSGPLSFKVRLLDGDMIWKRQDHLRHHQEATVTEPFLDQLGKT